MEHLNLNLHSNFQVVYRNNLYHQAKCHFHDFPEKNGWVLDASDYTLTAAKLAESGTEPSKPTRFVHFMQSWLFFGLITATVYDDNRYGIPGHGNFEKRLRKGNYIDTSELSEILEEWQERETQCEDKAEQKLRLIRAELALEVARKVVKQYCHPYSNRFEESDQEAQYIDPCISLSLMVLGETLANAKAKIVHTLSFRARGWSGDASIGWGTPQIVLQRMNRSNWGKRTAKLLTSQFNEHATALLSVYASHMHLENLQTGHEHCTEEECTRIPKETQGTSHSPICPSEESCQEWNGANMEKVVEFLKQGQIPLMKFGFMYETEEDNHRDHPPIEVVGSAGNKDYVAISHVWSDGYGNKDANKLRKCQLRFFYDLLKVARDQRPSQYRTDADSELLPFWIDTLTIPLEDVNTRNKAISQIHRVYSQAKFTIVIDKGLYGEKMKEGDYTATAMRILASGWMRRLWTLQEAYLSRRLLFVFGRLDTLTKFTLVDLDEIDELYIDANNQLVSNLPTNARDYYHNMLGQDRQARIHKLISNKNVGLVASAWKAAQ